MAKHQNSRTIAVPSGWPRQVKSAMLHVIALAQYAVAYTRSWAVDGRITRVRLKAENDHLRQQVGLLTEEIRIKDARMKRVDPQKRPHCLPTERMAILELRAARAWSVQRTAEAFLVTAATIASWCAGPPILVPREIGGRAHRRAQCKTVVHCGRWLVESKAESEPRPAHKAAHRRTWRERRWTSWKKVAIFRTAPLRPRRAAPSLCCCVSATEA
ncbi:MAG: hypothetical protein ACYSVY_14940 [Planctomycetota bacterium]|jgi:hypothetical protein